VTFGATTSFVERQHGTNRGRFVRVPVPIPMHVGLGMTVDGVLQDRQRPDEPRHGPPVAGGPKTTLASPSRKGSFSGLRDVGVAEPLLAGDAGDLGDDVRFRLFIRKAKSAPSERGHPSRGTGPEPERFRSARPKREITAGDTEQEISANFEHQESATREGVDLVVFFAAHWPSAIRRSGAFGFCQHHDLICVRAGTAALPRELPPSAAAAFSSSSTISSRIWGSSYRAKKIKLRR